MIQYLSLHKDLTEQIEGCQKCQSASTLPPTQVALYEVLTSLVSALSQHGNERKAKDDHVRALTSRSAGIEGPTWEMRFAGRDMYAACFAEVERHFSALMHLAPVHLAECRPDLKNIVRVWHLT